MRRLIAVLPPIRDQALSKLSLEKRSAFDSHVADEAEQKPGRLCYEMAKPAIWAERSYRTVEAQAGSLWPLG
jgi:hypothetical protein